MTHAEQAGLDRLIRFEKGLCCPLCECDRTECECTSQEIQNWSDAACHADGNAALLLLAFCKLAEFNDEEAENEQTTNQRAV